MKPLQFIPPALAVLGSAYWLLSQNNTISDLSEKTKVIKERIIVYEEATAATPAVVLGAKDANEADAFILDDGSLDWKAIAEMMAEMMGPNGMGMPTDIKAMLKLQKKMMELTESELIDGLAAISSLDLEPAVSSQLKQGLLQRLGETDPLAALKGLGDPVTSRENPLFWTQQNLLTKLAKDDPNAALKWLDQQIADGKIISSTLDMHNDARLNLESVLLGGLISSDLPAAKARLKNYESDQVEFMLNSSDIEVTKSGPKFAELARELLPPDKASSVIAQKWSQNHYTDLSDASKALSTAGLTDAEKSRVVEQMARNYSRSNNSETKFSEIYEWSRTESPGNEAAVVANALAKSRSSIKRVQSRFEKALELSGNLNDPEITNQFVSEMAKFNTVDHLVTQFKDPRLAEQFQSIHAALPQTSTESE